MNVEAMLKTLDGALDLVPKWRHTKEVDDIDVYQGELETGDGGRILFLIAHLAEEKYADGTATIFPGMTLVRLTLPLANKGVQVARRALGKGDP